MCFASKEGMLRRNVYFAKMTLSPRLYLTRCHNKGMSASKLKAPSFSIDEMYLSK